MKKAVLGICTLVFLDQCIKLIIVIWFFDINMSILPPVLDFRPVHNTHLSYLGSLLDTKFSIIFMIAIDAIYIVLIIFIYRYFIFFFQKRRKLDVFALCFSISGVLCAFIDQFFWGGSLDYIKLFDWFIFDLKDIYLCTMVTLQGINIIIYTYQYYRLSKEERKKYYFMPWIKSGCPMAVK